MTITITRRLQFQILGVMLGCWIKSSSQEFWETLADITERPPMWLRYKAGDRLTNIRYLIVTEDDDYGEVT